MGRPLLVVLLLSSMGCRAAVSTAPTAAEPTADGPEWFRDITSETGINHRHHAGPTGDYFLPQVMGSGVAVFDANNDGRPDILALANAGPKSDSTHRLYLQEPGGKFRDATAGSGIGVAGYGMGVAIGDCDNDGWLDVYISEYGGGRLFQNKGNGTFEDITAPANLRLPRWGSSCSFLDYDRDGWLDLVVATYVDYDPSRSCPDRSGRTDYCHPNQFRGTSSRLFHNRGRGPDGRWRGYEDVTAQSGLARSQATAWELFARTSTGTAGLTSSFPTTRGRTISGSTRGMGHLTESALIFNIAYNAVGNPQANMGIALGDMSGVGRGDLFVTHLSEELHTLWTQEGNGHFRDTTGPAGLANPRWRGTGFGTVAVDFDHDGWLDLAVANGRVMRSRASAPSGPVRADLPAFWHTYAERNQLFRGKGQGKFADASPANPAFCGPAAVSRGLAWADLDGDGAVDLVTTEIEGPMRVFKNIAPKSGHWLLVRAFDTALKRDALGAAVRVKAGSRTWLGFACAGAKLLFERRSTRSLWPRSGDDLRRDPGGLDRWNARALSRRRGRSRDHTESRYWPADPKMNTAFQSAARHLRGWRIHRLLTVVLCLLAAGGTWWYFRGREPVAEPPTVDLSRADPEVARAVAGALDEVRAHPRDAARWGRLGMYLRAHDFDTESIAAFRAAARLDPADYRWPYLEGLTLVLFEPDAGLERLRRAAELAPPARPEPRFYLAERLLERGDLDGAAALAETVRSTEPRNGRASLILARAAAARHDWGAVIEHATVAAGDAGCRRPAALLRGEAFAAQGESGPANIELRAAAALPRPPGWPDPVVAEVEALRVGTTARLAQANALLEQGRGMDALALIEEAARASPNSPGPSLFLGQTLIQAQNSPAAPGPRTVRDSVPRIGGRVVQPGRGPFPDRCHWPRG